MKNLPTLDEAIAILRPTVKMSNIENQFHVDLTLVDPSKRKNCQMALVKVQKALKDGEIAQGELNRKLGL